LVLHFLKDRSILLIAEEEYLTVLAPATGVLLAITIKAIGKYRQHHKRFNNKIFKLNKRIKTPIYNPIRDTLIRLIVLKISYIYGKVILICAKLNRIIFIILNKAPIDLQFWTISIRAVTELVIISRAGRILFDLGKYLVKNKTNVLKTGINTLIWIIDDEARTLVYKLAFIGVSLTTAIIWTHVPLLRKILRIWTTITLFNLCSNIEVVDGHQLWLKHGPQATAFGLPPRERIEHPIPEFKPKAEQLKNPRLILPGNKTEVILSSPLQNETRANISKDVTLETSEISKNSILDTERRIFPKEEVIIGPKEEATIIVPEEEITIIVPEEEATIILPEEELRETNPTSKIKRTIKKSRINNLQKLNEKFNSPGDDITPWDIDDNVQNETNYTKVREGKVK
jgi:hypothetical protein